MSNETDKNAIGEVFDSKKESAANVYDEIMKKCPVLYRQRKLPMTQTCMCWGIDCGPGWREPINNLSVAIEVINNDVGRKYGFAVEAVQVKEKYGTLRFYYNMNGTKFFDFSRILAWPFTMMYRMTGNMKMLNVACAIRDSYRVNSRWRRERRLVIEWVDELVHEMVAKADRECYDRCEVCGCQIGVDWSPRCETTGWVSYVCDECARKRDVVYSMIDKKTGKTRYYMKGEDITDSYLEKMQKEEEEMKRRYEEWKKKEEEKKNEQV